MYSSLLDRYPELPFSARVPWPCVYDVNGQMDWVNTVSMVETWLNQRIGAHYVRWSWCMWGIDSAQLCGVSFAQQPDRLLFLLQFGSA